MTIGVTPASHSGISNQAQAEQAAAKIRLERLRVIASAVNAGGDIETILDRVLVAVCRGEPWPRGGIMAVNRQSGYSEMVTGYDPDGPLPGRPRRWALVTSPVPLVAETRRPLVIVDAQRSERYPGYQEDARARGYRTRPWENTRPEGAVENSMLPGSSRLTEQPEASQNGRIDGY